MRHIYLYMKCKGIIYKCYNFSVEEAPGLIRFMKSVLAVSFYCPAHRLANGNKYLLIERDKTRFYFFY